MKGKVMLVAGICGLLGLLGEGKFFRNFGENNMIADVTTLVIIAGLLIGGIAVMLIERKK